ncbi:hypothetical protein E2C01_083344 [Portunus trituberculatus]|uniref:Uncharacterized protein n=1 Tax=Portunus trituberculatus TaxID=210409 RepID=A0A5B7IS71_PORTR|nr:hypothetical protein [Portunus trituberculatus]
MSDREPQSLATVASVRGKASKQWKPMGDHIPATRSCGFVAPQSRSLVYSRPY